MQHAAAAVAEMALTEEAVGLLIVSVRLLCCSWCLRCNAAGHMQNMAVEAVALAVEAVGLLIAS